MTSSNLIAFLDGDSLAHRTRQARLSHFRKLLEALHAQQPRNPYLEQMYKQVKMIKVKQRESEK